MSCQSWDMWAGERTTGGTTEVVFCHVGTDPRHPRMHGVDEPVPVRVTVNPEGRYWGWVPAHSAETGEPVMISEHRTLFAVCFPNGYVAEEEAGNGRAVRLDITHRMLDTVDATR